MLRRQGCGRLRPGGAGINQQNEWLAGARGTRRPGRRSAASSRRRAARPRGRTRGARPSQSLAAAAVAVAAMAAGAGGGPAAAPRASGRGARSAAGRDVCAAPPAADVVADDRRAPTPGRGGGASVRPTAAPGGRSTPWLAEGPRGGPGGPASTRRAPVVRADARPAGSPAGRPAAACRALATAPGRGRSGTPPPGGRGGAGGRVGCLPWGRRRRARGALAASRARRRTLMGSPRTRPLVAFEAGRESPAVDPRLRTDTGRLEGQKDGHCAAKKPVATSLLESRHRVSGAAAAGLGCASQPI